MCLTESGSSDGTPYTFTPCGSGQGQTWTWNPSMNQLKGVSSGLCFDSSGSGGDGTVPHMWDCNTGNTNQVFRFNNGLVIGPYNNLCLSVSGDQSTVPANAKATLRTCDSTQPDQNIIWKQTT
jgi:glucosylceramidase